MSGHELEFKGTSFTLSVVHLGDAGLPQLEQYLKNKIDNAPAFFHCAPLVVNAAKVKANFDFVAMRNIIEAQGFIPVGVTGISDSAKKRAVHKAGLAVITSGVEQKNAKVETISVNNTPPSPSKNAIVKPTKVLRQHIRSGQQVYAENANLVVFGSVSNGAEVISDGDIHILGALRGRAIAGAKGNTKAQIFSHKLQAELVSIAGTYMLNEQLQDYLGHSYHIQIEQGQMTFNPISS